MNQRQRSERSFDLNTFLPYKLSNLSRLTQALLASALAESGMTIAQWRVYLCLATLGPSHLNGIAAFTRLPQSSLSRSIAQMAERGVVRSARNESDRRIAQIELSAQGRKHLEQLTAAMDKTCEAVFQMTPTEEAAFHRTIDDLVARLSARLGDAAAAAASEPGAPRMAIAMKAPPPKASRSRARTPGARARPRSS